MKKDKINRLVEQNQHNQSIDKRHNSCQDKNNDKIDKTDRYDYRHDT